MKWKTRTTASSFKMFTPNHNNQRSGLGIRLSGSAHGLLKVHALRMTSSKSCWRCRPSISCTTVSRTIDSTTSLAGVLPTSLKVAEFRLSAFRFPRSVFEFRRALSVLELELRHNGLSAVEEKEQEPESRGQSVEAEEPETKIQGQRIKTREPNPMS